MTKIAAGQKFATIASTVDTTERKSASQNASTEVYTIEDVIETTLGLNSPILYKEVELTADDIKSLVTTGYVSSDTTPADVFPLLVSAVLVFNPQTSYNNPGIETDLVLYFGPQVVSTDVNILLQSSGSEYACTFYPASNSFGQSVASLDYDGSYPLFALYITGGQGDDLTTGTGTAILKLSYRLVSFQSEL